MSHVKGSRPGAVASELHSMHESVLDDWSRMHAVLVTWKLQSLFREAVLELDRAPVDATLDESTTRQLEHVARSVRSSLQAVQQLQRTLSNA